MQMAGRRKGHPGWPTAAALRRHVTPRIAGVGTLKPLVGRGCLSVAATSRPSCHWFALQESELKELLSFDPSKTALGKNDNKVITDEELAVQPVEAAFATASGEGV